MGKEQPPKLSEKEQTAKENKKAGKPYDKGDYKSGQEKEKTTEKLSGKRNEQKRESNY